MSTTQGTGAPPRGARDPHDYYRTPIRAVGAVLPYLRLRPGATVLDPCAGDGAIMDVLTARGFASVGIEIDPARATISGAVCADALDEDAAWPHSDGIVMNPPFSRAEEFILRARRACPDGDVAVLLRLSLLAGQARAALWAGHPADVIVLAERPSFTAHLRAPRGAQCLAPIGRQVCRLARGHAGDCMSCGTDATEYMWSVFGPGRGGSWARV